MRKFMVPAVAAGIAVVMKDQWLFTKRRIYNEGRAEWAYKGGGNPAW
jgi:hypothetical protein